MALTSAIVSREMRSKSAVDTPGAIASPMRFSTVAAALPLRFIFSISSLFLILTLSIRLFAQLRYVLLCCERER